MMRKTYVTDHAKAPAAVSILSINSSLHSIKALPIPASPVVRFPLVRLLAHRRARGSVRNCACHLPANVDSAYG
jgi:hypothetical protein